MSTTTEVEAKVKAKVEIDPMLVEAGRDFLHKYAIDSQHMSDEEVVELVKKVKKTKAATAEVLSRGPTLSAAELLLSYVPKGFQGEFFRNDSHSIHRAKAKGWEIFHNEEAAKQTSTGSGDTTVLLGDQILMIQPLDIYLAEKVNRAERLRDRRAKRNIKAKANRELPPEFQLFDLKEK